MQEWTESITEIGEEEQSNDSHSEIDPKELSTKPAEEIDQEIIIQTKGILQTFNGYLKNTSTFFCKKGI